VNGLNNTAIGDRAGQNIIGNNNVALGNSANAIGGTFSNAVAIGSLSVATGNFSTAIGGSDGVTPGASATGTSSIAIGTSSVASATNSIAVGTGAQVTAANAVAIGTGSVASAPNTVSVGAPGAERRLTNLAPGVLPTDAATVSQLGAMTGGLQTQVNGLQNQVGGLQNQVNSLTKESRRGVAAAIALGSGKTPSAPGKTTIALGSGFYHGETGVGVAVEHWLDFATIPIVVQAGFANGGGNENAGRVGVAFEF
jgi:hypothetical protein